MLQDPNQIISSTQESTSEKIASTQALITADVTKAIVTNPAAKDLLFRLVVIESPDSTDQYLGFVEGATFEAQSQKSPILTIKNLRELRKDRPYSQTVRDPPHIGWNVRFASANDLSRFLESREQSPTLGYIGYVRDTNTSTDMMTTTKYPLPIDLNRLMDGNVAILAGSGSGKSHLAAMLAALMHLVTKMRVLVIDPSGEWRRESGPIWTVERQLHNGSNNASRASLSIVCYEVRDTEWSKEEVLGNVIDSLERGDLTILDLSFALSTATAEAKLRARCELVERLAERLMSDAQRRYRERPSNVHGQVARSAIILEESHEFVPAVSPERTDLQQKLARLYEIATKEYRKYGLGHVFIDQSLGAIAQDLQIQTFLLGLTTTPTDVGHLKQRLGTEVVEAVDRTTSVSEGGTWVVYGNATPVHDIPWEVEVFDKKNNDLIFRIFEGTPSLFSLIKLRTDPEKKS